MEIVIEAGQTEKRYWRDLWKYRELFQVLARRDIAVRYKQTIIGVAWAVIRPFLTMVVFTIIFGKVAKLPSEGATPYALMVIVGMLPWTFFASSLSEASNSLVSNANLVGKVYFPRLIIPASTVVAGLIDFLISLSILAGMMVFYQFNPGWKALLLPLFIAIAFIASLGPGLWIASLNARYRDFRYVVPFLLQLGLYISPVGFSSSIVSEKWRLLYALNPMAGVIDGFRWCLLDGESAIDWPAFAISMAVAGLLMWVGVRQFRKTEKSLADII